MSFARQSLGSLAALAIGLLVSIALPLVLGAEARGEYQLVVKLAGLVLAVAQWGVPEVLLQMVGEGRAQSGALIGTSVMLGVAGAVVIGLVLWLAEPLARDNVLRGVDGRLEVLTLVGSVAALVALLARRFIQLGGRLDIYNGSDIGRTVLFLLLVLVAGALLPRQAIGPTLAWLLAEVALAVAALIFVWRRLAVVTTWRFDRRLARELATSGAPIQLGMLAMFLGSEGGAFVLNAHLDLATVGVYAVALSMSRLVLQVSTALRTALQPRLIGPQTDSATMTALVTRHGLLWMVLASIGLAIASPLVPVVFTREFSGAATALVLLLPGMIAYGVWQLLASHLLRIGRRGILAAIAWLFAVFSIALQSALAPSLGLAGAAIGLTLAYMVACGAVLFCFLRLTGQSARDVVPTVGDVAFYVGLTRRMLATHG